MSIGPRVEPVRGRRAPFRRTGAWLWPTARLALSPATRLAFVTAVVPVVLVRLVARGSAEPPEAVGVSVAFVLAVATATMLADDAAATLAPVGASPARRALRRGVVAASTVGAALLAVASIGTLAWPDQDVIDTTACLALAATAGAVTAMVRPTGARDASAAAVVGGLAALALVAVPAAVGELRPVGRWVATAASWWSTDPGWWTLGVLVTATGVLRRR